MTRPSRALRETATFIARPGLDRGVTGTAVRARNLVFTYKPSGFSGKKLPPSLTDVSLDIREGEVYGLLGPNGAGKTTLIKILATLLLPDEGDLEILGASLPGGEDLVRPHLGVALAEYERTFHFRLTGRENLRFFASFLDVPRHEVAPRVAEVLEQVGLTEAADKMFLTYSTGMKHRLAVARALLGKPRLLIFDEPTAGLDAATSRALGDLILRLAKEEKATVLYTTHRLEEAGRLCDRIAILRKGRVIAEEAPAALRRLSTSVSVIRLRLDAVPDTTVAALRSVPQVTGVYVDGADTVRLHVTSVEEALKPVLGAAERERRRVLGLVTTEPSVEDVFLQLTRDEKEVAAPAR